MRRAILATALLLPTGFAALPVAAQGSPADLAACVAVTDPAERLACYDRAVPAFLAAPAARTATPAAPAAPATPTLTPEQRFGAGHLEETKAAQAATELDAITAKVVEVREFTHGRLSLTLDNGQVWHQAETVALRVKAGDRVTIETGIFGSYNLSVSGRNGLFKVRRVR